MLWLLLVFIAVVAVVARIVADNSVLSGRVTVVGTGAVVVDVAEVIVSVLLFFIVIAANDGVAVGLRRLLLCSFCPHILSAALSR